jgi:hypothetical protein
VLAAFGFAADDDDDDDDDPNRLLESADVKMLSAVELDFFAVAGLLLANRSSPKMLLLLLVSFVDDAGAFLTTGSSSNTDVSKLMLSRALAELVLYGANEHTASNTSELAIIQTRSVHAYIPQQEVWS